MRRRGVRPRRIWQALMVVVGVLLVAAIWVAEGAGGSSWTLAGKLAATGGTLAGIGFLALVPELQ